MSLRATWILDLALLCFSTVQTAVFAAGRDVRDKGLKPEEVNLSHRFTIAFMSLAGVAEVGVISKHSEAIDHAG